MKSVVYLCCPVQSQGWTFLTALTTFLKGDWDENDERRSSLRGSLISGTTARPESLKKRTIWVTGLSITMNC